MPISDLFEKNVKTKNAKTCFLNTIQKKRFYLYLCTYCDIMPRPCYLWKKFILCHTRHKSKSRSRSR